MKYKAKDGREYLVYCYSDYRDMWKVENFPFDGTVSVLTESLKNKFIKDNRLKELNEMRSISATVIPEDVIGINTKDKRMIFEVGFYPANRIDNSDMINWDMPKVNRILVIDEYGYFYLPKGKLCKGCSSNAYITYENGAYEFYDKTFEIICGVRKIKRKQNQVTLF